MAGFYNLPWLRISGFVLIVLGVFIFCTQRYIDYKESKEHGFGPGNKNTSLPLMGDIFNISGQRTGGRTEDFPSNNNSGSSDGGGGGE